MWIWAGVEEGKCVSICEMFPIPRMAMRVYRRHISHHRHIHRRHRSSSHYGPCSCYNHLACHLIWSCGSGIGHHCHRNHHCHCHHLEVRLFKEGYRKRSMDCEWKWCVFCP